MTPVLHLPCAVPLSGSTPKEREYGAGKATMPELPEIETVKLQLQKYLVGQDISTLEQLHRKSVQGGVTQVQRKKITGVRRFGKMLVVDLTENLHLAIHFKMSGQLVLVRSSQLADRRNKDITKTRIAGGHPTKDWLGELPSKHTRAIIRLKNGQTLYFNDQRIFGWIKVLGDVELEKLLAQQNFGPEPWDLTDGEFHSRITTRRKAVKLVLMDQEVISGTGNIYANDALWEARIHPNIPARTLTKDQTKALRAGLIKVLKDGITYGGATAADAKYIDLDGMGGHYQEHFRVYDREGEKCLRKDGGVIKKITLGGRGTYYCPKCQKM